MPRTCPCGHANEPSLRQGGPAQTVFWIILGIVWYLVALVLLAAGAWPVTVGMVGLPLVGAAILSTVNKHRGWCWVRLTLNGMLLAPSLVIRLFFSILTRLPS